MRTAFSHLQRFLKYNNGYYLTFLLFGLFLQSCGTESGYLQCSIDGNSQVASGPSYPRESVTGKGYAGNVALIFVGAQDGPAVYRSTQPSSMNFQAPDKFYADADIDPASLALNGGQKTEQQVTNKTTADFMSHVNYMGGIEFVQKRSDDGGQSTALNYIEIPVYGLYQAPLATGTVFGGLGPYVAYGIGGSTKASFGGHTTSSASFDATTGYKRFDAGLGITAGSGSQTAFILTWRMTGGSLILTVTHSVIKPGIVP